MVFYDADTLEVADVSSYLTLLSDSCEENTGDTSGGSSDPLNDQPVNDWDDLGSEDDYCITYPEQCRRRLNQKGRRLAVNTETWEFAPTDDALSGASLNLFLAASGVQDPENSGISFSIVFAGADNTPPYFSNSPPDFSLTVGETATYTLPFFQDDEDLPSDLSLAVLINSSGSYPGFISVADSFFQFNPVDNSEAGTYVIEATVTDSDFDNGGAEPLSVTESFTLTVEEAEEETVAEEEEEPEEECDEELEDCEPEVVPPSFEGGFVPPQ